MVALKFLSSPTFKFFAIKKSFMIVDFCLSLSNLFVKKLRPEEGLYTFEPFNFPDSSALFTNLTFKKHFEIPNFPTFLTLPNIAIVSFIRTLWCVTFSNTAFLVYLSRTNIEKTANIEITRKLENIMANRTFFLVSLKDRISSIINIKKRITRVMM